MIWVLAGFTVCIASLYLYVKIKSNSKRDHDVNMDNINTADGNVSVFMDKKGNIDIIPFSLDRLKRGKASEYPLSLKNPYTAAELGAYVRKGLSLSSGGRMLESEELMKSLGFYAWKDYSAGKKSVSVICNDAGIVLNSTVRHTDGSYSFRYSGYEKTLPKNTSDELLGKEVLELMKVSG
ncbi:MAG: hypothetical protein GX494_01540 [Clostridiaceae bacterium]|nr:hypothetical protein [Clostridiaceae bacterium]